MEGTCKKLSICCLVAAQKSALVVQLMSSSKWEGIALLLSVWFNDTISDYVVQDDFEPTTLQQISYRKKERKSLRDADCMYGHGKNLDFDQD